MQAEMLFYCFIACLPNSFAFFAPQKKAGGDGKRSKKIKKATTAVA
jgi:hypothetical protein